MRAPSRVTTERLILSEPHASDAAAVFERYAGDPEVTRYLGWPTHRAVADTENFLAFAAMQWARSGAGPYLVRACADGRLVGSAGLALEDGGRAMTGYVLARDSWGRGYATEILRAMVDVAGAIGITTIYALCHAEHRASWHVLEKCAFERDPAWTRRAEFPNLVPGVMQDVVCYERRLEGLETRAGGAGAVEERKERHS
jgi:[ribosomal protein S5]-alanine N-acetyltransferase